MSALALPASKSIKTQRNKRRGSKCHLNSPECSLSQKRISRSYFTVQACEDDGEYSCEKPMLDITISHCSASTYDGFKFPSQNLYTVQTDRPCTHQELVELTRALIKALELLPEDGTPV